MHLGIYFFMCVCMCIASRYHVYMYEFIDMCMCVYMCVCIYLCMYSYMNLCIVTTKNSTEGLNLSFIMTDT